MPSGRGELFAGRASYTDLWPLRKGQEQPGPHLPRKCIVSSGSVCREGLKLLRATLTLKSPPWPVYRAWKNHSGLGTELHIFLHGL